MPARDPQETSSGHVTAFNDGMARCSMLRERTDGNQGQEIGVRNRGQSEIGVRVQIPYFTFHFIGKSGNRGQGPNSVFYLPFHRCVFFHSRICFVSSDLSEWVRERILYFPFSLPLFLPNSPKPPVRGSSPVDFAARSPPPRLTLRLIRYDDEESSRSMWGGWPVRGRYCEVKGRQENGGRRI